MKKLLSLLTVLALLAGAVPAFAEPAAADSGALPAVGEVVNGFEALEIREFPMIGAQLVLFEHQKTGAKLLYIANGDTNRVFQLTFLTRPTDDTGLPHVFEHSTLSGSEKYPSASLWTNLSYQTYNTYMNAYTTDAMTCYPVASLSEAQLLKYADFYTDSCLHPNILTDESIYRTEAWRYQMASMDDDLTLIGTVYSEMQGAYNLSRGALYNANRATFPGASLAYSYGGDPDAIPDMTYEALRDYHEKFYHPSNCIAYLYGQFDDYAAFLALLDEAFSPYDKAVFQYAETEYEAITGPVEAKYPFPMEAGTDTENQSEVYYYIVCPGMKGDVEQEQIIDNLFELMSLDSSILMQNLKKALPGGSFSFGRELAAPDDAIVFLARNVNEDDGRLFKETVDASLKEFAEKGFDEDMVDSAMASLNLSTKLAPEAADPVEGVVYSLAYNYAVTGNPFSYVENVESLSHLKEWNSGLYQQAAARWLLDRDTWTLTTTYPAAGEKEKHDEALAAKLAEIKAGMTEEELQAIIDATNAAPVEDDASALVAQLQAVTVESLPEEIREYAVTDETGDDGIRRISAVAGVDGIGKAGIYLDAQALPQEDIHWLRLFTRLLGNLDTDAHTKEELDVLITRYLYDKTFGVSVNGDQNAYHPYFIAEWTAMDEDLAAGYDLAYEIVYGTRFDDAQTLLDKITKEKNSVRNTINGSPYNVMMFRAFGIDNPMWRYYNYLNYLDYYAFLEQVEALAGENPEEVSKHLAAVQSFFFNNAGAIETFAGNEESIAVNRPLADAFLQKLDHVEREAASYDLPVPSKREAMIADINVQFNNVFASFADMEMDGFDASLEAVTALVADAFLFPILRDQLSVYTPWNGEINHRGMYLITYRDPNVRETFDVYAKLPEMIAGLEISQDELNGYILNAYVPYAQGAGELTGASSAVENAISGISQDQALAYMKQLKAVTPETVKAAADIYQKAWDNGVHSTAGAASAINANADLYDVILNPFNAKDASQVSFTDVTEDSEYYAAVRFVYENGIMAAKADDAFGVDDAATKGDFLAGLYVIFGGAPNAAEEARAWLASYGLVEADEDLDAGLNEGFFCDIMANGIGVGVSTDTPDTLVSRGVLADQLQQLYQLLNQ